MCSEDPLPDEFELAVVCERSRRRRRDIGVTINWSHFRRSPQSIPVPLRKMKPCSTLGFHRRLRHASCAVCCRLGPHCPA